MQKSPKTSRMQDSYILGKSLQARVHDTLCRHGEGEACAAITCHGQRKEHRHARTVWAHLRGVLIRHEGASGFWSLYQLAIQLAHVDCALLGACSFKTSSIQNAITSCRSISHSLILLSFFLILGGACQYACNLLLQPLRQTPALQVTPGLLNR